MARLALGARLHPADALFGDLDGEELLAGRVDIEDTTLAEGVLGLDQLLVLAAEPERAHPATASSSATPAKMMSRSGMTFSRASRVRMATLVAQWFFMSMAPRPQRQPSFTMRLKGG